MRALSPASLLVGFVVVALILGFASAAAAEEGDGEVAAVEAGQPAPFAGVLLSDARFEVVAGLQLALDEANGKLRNRDEALDEAARRQATLESELSEARSSGACEGGWWSRHGFTVGVVVGVAATVTATVLLWNAVSDSGGGG